MKNKIQKTVLIAVIMLFGINSFAQITPIDRARQNAADRNGGSSSQVTYPMPDCLSCPWPDNKMLSEQFIFETGSNNNETYLRYRPSATFNNIMNTYTNSLKAFVPSLQLLSSTWTISNNPSQTTPVSINNSGQVTPTYNRLETNNILPYNNGTDSWIEWTGTQSNVNPRNLYAQKLELNKYYKVSMCFWTAPKDNILTEGPICKCREFVVLPLINPVLKTKNGKPSIKFMVFDQNGKQINK